jgi:hypothetical protein
MRTTTASPNTVPSFATAIGAGIDLKFLPHIWIRPFQVDYQPRISAGLVLHF